MEPSLATDLRVATEAAALKDVLTRIVKSADEDARRNHAAWLDALLAHHAAYAICAVINAAMKDPVNVIEMNALVAWCETDAVFKRNVHELASVYLEPARRRVSSGDEKYQELLEVLAMNATMQAANRKLVAHEAVWLSMRVRDGEPVLDVLTPAQFWAVYPAHDPTHLVGIVTEIPRGIGAPSEAPAYRLDGRHESYILNTKFERIEVIPNAHAPRLPGVLVALEPANVARRLLPLRPNHDLAQADASSAFSRLMALRESLTVQKQAYISGDTANVTMGQTQASAREVFLGEGVNVTTVDRSVDVSSYLRHAEAIADTASANHGVAPSVRKQQDATSGFEAWLRRAPLVERRRAQIDALRRGERQLAAHMRDVVDDAKLEQYTFSVDGWSVDFGELSAPEKESEQLANFETRRRLGLDDTIAETMRRNPDLTTEQAIEDVATHAQRESERIAMLQGLSKMNANTSTAVGDSTNGARNNNGNGAPQVAGEEQVH